MFNISFWAKGLISKLKINVSVNWEKSGCCGGFTKNRP